MAFPMDKNLIKSLSKQSFNNIVKALLSDARYTSRIILYGPNLMKWKMPQIGKVRVGLVISWMLTFHGFTMRI